MYYNYPYRRSPLPCNHHPAFRVCVSLAQSERSISKIAKSPYTRLTPGGIAHGLVAVVTFWQRTGFSRQANRGESQFRLEIVPFLHVHAHTHTHTLICTDSARNRIKGKIVTHHAGLCYYVARERIMAGFPAPAILASWWWQVVVHKESFTTWYDQPPPSPPREL